ncbi:MAG TPA: HEAT repeat domain-containing protein [Gemmatimonadaceae bacterium]|nr:HEAT repeat domain-containing protein [Gemmatimonadaceae bacterium]
MLAYIVALFAAGTPARAQFAAQEVVAMPPVGQFPDDPADSLYTAARAAMAKQQYSRAADLFHEITSRYPRSSYASNAAYYEAFSRSRLGDIDNLREAYRILSSSSSKDAASLQAQVCAAMVKKGDSSCKQRLRSMADEGNKEATTDGPDKCPTEDDDNDIRMSALNALLQVDAEKALPILKQVLAKRDACSVELRRKAVFLVSQKAESDGADILLSTARTDPDEEVREQAVFWLSQVHDPRAVGMLDSLLLHSDNEAIREKAMFALTQQHDHGSPMLRDFATREGESEDLREKAVFWLGQTNNPDDEAWLKTFFRQAKNEDLKEKIIFSIAQHHDSGDWLLGVVTDSTQSMDTRKKALFWLGQEHSSVNQLVSMYSKLNDQELKEAVIFALSQQKGSAAIDELMTIAKTDKDPELRKKAVFWLGQSHDPRVAQFLLELINK